MPQRRSPWPGGQLGVSWGAQGAAAIATSGVSALLKLFLARKGPRQRTETTAMVNQLEPALKQNVALYLAGPRTATSQAAALAEFDAAWAWLSSSQACGNSAEGNPGKACIKDRSRGGQWDWWSYYRDPIANDTQVKPDVASEILAALTGQTGSGGMLVWLGIGLLVLGVVL